MIEFDLFKDELFVFLDLQTVQFEVEVKILHGISSWLILRKVQSLHVWMLKGLVNCNSLFWIKCQHLLDEVDSIRIGVALEEFVKVLALVWLQLPHENLVIWVLNLLNEILPWRSHQLGNHHHLFLFILGGQERLAADELGQDAADTPNIDGSRVLSPGKNDFGRTIPPRGNIVSQSCILSHESFDICPCQSKVTNLQITVAVYQQIPWLQVAMNDATRVDVLETAQNLIQEELYMLIAQHLV